jgi:glycosyltransferase involved in cell wall biosynthesis
MRCVYIVANDPISPNSVGGGGAIHYEQLVSLVSLGVEVSLWHFCYEDRVSEFERYLHREPDTWKYIESLCSKIFRSLIPCTPTFAERLRNKVSSKLTRLEIRNPALRNWCYPILDNILHEVDPHFVWAQHIAPAQTSLLQTFVPVVYSHHDWLYRVKSKAQSTHPDLSLRKTEEKIARRVAAVVSGSRIECNDLERIGCTNVHYIPVAYDEVAVTSIDCKNEAQIVHLGGLGTTASRLGLERFFESVWANLNLSGDRMVVVGDMSTASDKMRAFLLGVRTTGFVSDLSMVLRPHDIHVIPWEYETGQRTRLVRAFSYKQAVVATRKSVACFPEAVNHYNCILVDSLDQMPRSIERLLNNASLRKEIGNNARKTFETCFTRRVLLPRYQRVIESLALA